MGLGPGPVWHPICTVLFGLSWLVNPFWAAEGLRDSYQLELFGLQATETQFQLDCVIGEALRWFVRLRQLLQRRPQGLELELGCF